MFSISPLSRATLKQPELLQLKHTLLLLRVRNPSRERVTPLQQWARKTMLGNRDEGPQADPSPGSQAVASLPKGVNTSKKKDKGDKDITRVIWGLRGPVRGWRHKLPRTLGQIEEHPRSHPVTEAVGCKYHNSSAGGQRFSVCCSKL